MKFALQHENIMVTQLHSDLGVYMEGSPAEEGFSQVCDCGGNAISPELSQLEPIPRGGIANL